MAVEIVHFLMAKFADGLRAEGIDSAILFERRFRELKWELEKRIRPPMPLDTTNLLRELLYDLNDMLIECQTLSRRRSDRRQRRGVCIGCYSLRDFWYRYKARKRLLMIMQRIQTIGNEGVGLTAITGDEAGKGKAMEFDRWTPTAVDVSKIHGISEQALEMEQLLIEQGGRGFRGVGIAGMGGVGKTTLAQLVFNSPHVRRHFRPRLWVCMSQTSERGKDTRKDTVERMLMSLGVDEEEIHSAQEGMTESQSLAVLTFMLHLQLRGKRYLIVFDDMWSMNEWYDGLDYCGSPREGEGEWGDRLAYALPKGDGGGVIVTGRIEAVVELMVGEGSTRLLTPLESREACWSIFMDAYVKGGHAVDGAALRAMEVEIMDKCCGLPLAARTLGEIMSEMMSSSPGASSRGWSSSLVSTSCPTSGTLE